MAIVCETECGSKRLLFRASDIYGNVFFAGEVVRKMSRRVGELIEHIFLALLA